MLDVCEQLHDKDWAVEASDPGVQEIQRVLVALKVFLEITCNRIRVRAFGLCSRELLNVIMH